MYHARHTTVKIYEFKVMMIKNILEINIRHNMFSIFLIVCNGWTSLKWGF
jgi:hypothetical protein